MACTINVERPSRWWIFPPFDEWGDDKTIMGIFDAYKSCKPLLQEHYPKRLIETEEIIEHEENYIEAGLTPPRRKLFPLPPIFCSVLTFVNEPTAELLSGFNLGKTELHKLPLYARDGKTPHEACAYWLNMLEFHPCFNAELSDDYDTAGYVDIPGRGKTERWMVYDGDDNTVLNGPLPDTDLWWDPQVSISFFVSDRLAQALKKQKGGKKLSFIRCKVAGA